LDIVDERARKRGERERTTITALAMIAPTPEMVRQVMALDATSIERPKPRLVYADVDIEPDLEAVTADR